MRGSVSIRDNVLTFYCLGSGEILATFPVTEEQCRGVKDILYSLMISHSDLEKDGLNCQIKGIQDHCRLLREQEARDAQIIKALSGILKPVLPENMGGNPDLFWPEGFEGETDGSPWDSWEIEAKAALALAEGR